jgi:hypothetical protein
MAAADRYEAVDSMFPGMADPYSINPENVQAMGSQALDMLHSMGGSVEGGEGNLDMTNPGTLAALVEQVKQLSLVMVEADSGLSSLVGNFQSLGEGLGLSQEAIPAFDDGLVTLSAQLLQGQIGVDGFAAGVQSIASGLGLSNEQGAALVQAVLAMIAPMAQGGAAASLFGGGVGGAADALGRAMDAGNGLTAAANGLGGALAASGAQAGAAGAAIEGGINPALTSVSIQAALAAQQTEAVGTSIKSIPTSWQSNLYFTRYYQTVGEPFHTGGYVFHQGGLVLHDGGLAGPPRMHDGGFFNELLKPFEVPAILQRGEYVVRQSSVNAQTLPWLRQVNQTGTPPGAGGGTQIHVNAPLVQVQGGLASDPDAIEGLARLVEAKLMDLQDGRFGGEAA